MPKIFKKKCNSSQTEFSGDTPVKTARLSRRKGKETVLGGLATADVLAWVMSGERDAVAPARLETALKRRVAATAERAAADPTLSPRQRARAARHAAAVAQRHQVAARAKAAKRAAAAQAAKRAERAAAIRAARPAKPPTVAGLIRAALLAEPWLTKSDLTDRIPLDTSRTKRFRRIVNSLQWLWAYGVLCRRLSPTKVGSDKPFFNRDYVGKPLLEWAIADATLPAGSDEWLG